VGLWLLLIFIGLPILEIALFIVVGGAIGVLPTLMLVVLAAAAGIGVIRMQGANALARLQAAIDRGDDPAGPIAEGAIKAVAGVLLVVPGFFTDAVGLLLLVPPVRRALMRRGAGRVTVRAATYARTRRPGAMRPPQTIDADYEIVGEQPRPPGPSGWTQQP
jgi:UPF0716 protein FxsA